MIGGTGHGSSGSCSGTAPDTGSFTGLISDVAVFDDALSASQVETTFENPGDPFLADPTATPEPTPLALLAIGLCGLLALRRHRTA